MNLAAMVIIGLTGLIWFGYEVNWQAAVALYITLWANNALNPNRTVILIAPKKETED